LCPGCHTAAFRPSRPGPRQGPSSHPHFIVSVAQGPEVSKFRTLTALCGLRVSVESYVAPKAHYNASAASAFDIRSETAVMHHGLSRVGLPPLRWLLYPARTAPGLWLRVKPHGELPGMCEVERDEGRAYKAGARPWPKERRHSPHYRSERTAGRSLCRADGPGRGWYHVVRGGMFARSLPHQPVFQIPHTSQSRKLPRSLK